MEIDLRGGFSLTLGPFQASVDQLGVWDRPDARCSPAGPVRRRPVPPPRASGCAWTPAWSRAAGTCSSTRPAASTPARWSSPRRVGIKAIALITTKRPDGGEGWSLLLLIFGQFSVHIAFGIFLTGVGGLIGLHHRVDIDALIAGMKTGALDDILFPENPVADAPRLINRYTQLFPIEPDGLVIGPMLELWFTQPPIVFVRLGLLFEVRNALGGDRPVALTKVVLVGQLLAQLPQKALGLPAIVKLLIDVVGFYDARRSSS